MKIVSVSYSGGGVSWNISQLFRESTGQSLGFGLFLVMIDAFSSTSLLAGDPQGSLPLVAVLFDRKLSVETELTELLIHLWR